VQECLSRFVAEILPFLLVFLCRGTFTTYMAGSSGAVVFCLHGGGYTGLTWSLVAKQLKQQ
jgi:hypothetical protein